MKKLYVGNLPYSISEEGLEELFAQYGEIESVVVIKDRVTGRSKGFGFVEFKEEGNVKKAAAELDGKDFEGRTLRVNEAKPRESGRGGNKGGGSRRW